MMDISKTRHQDGTCLPEKKEGNHPTTPDSADKNPTYPSKYTPYPPEPLTINPAKKKKKEMKKKIVVLVSSGVHLQILQRCSEVGNPGNPGRVSQQHPGPIPAFHLSLLCLSIDTFGTNTYLAYVRRLLDSVVGRKKLSKTQLKTSLPTCLSPAHWCAPAAPSTQHLWALRPDNQLPTVYMQSSRSPDFPGHATGKRLRIVCSA